MALEMERQPCKYWEKCYRMNDRHLAKYLHPRDFEKPLTQIEPLPQTTESSSLGPSCSTSTLSESLVECTDTVGISCSTSALNESLVDGTDAPNPFELEVEPSASQAVPVPEEDANLLVEDGRDFDQRTEDGDTVHSDGEGSVVSSVAESVGKPKVRDGSSIHVENLPPSVKQSVVYNLFSKAGFRPVKRFNLIRRGKRDCACKITLDSESTARKAATALAGHNLDGRKIRIRYLPKADEASTGNVGQEVSSKPGRAETQLLDVQYTGRVTFVSATRIFIESSTPLPGEPPSKRSVYYPPNFYAATLFPLINNDHVSFTLAKKRATPKKETDRPPARNVRIVQYAKREKELIESYISTLMERIGNAEPSEIAALTSSLPTWVLLGLSLSDLRIESLIQLLLVIKKLMTSDTTFVNGPFFKSFVGHKFLHISSALNVFFEEMLKRNNPFELLAVFSFLRAVAKTARDPFLPCFIRAMSLEFGTRGFYQQSVSLMDILRKNKDLKPSKRTALPTYEELAVVPLENDPELLETAVGDGDFLESVAAALKLDMFSRISNALVEELSGKRGKKQDAVVLNEVMLTHLKFSPDGRLQFIIESNTQVEAISAGSLFVLSQERDFKKFAFGTILSVLVREQTNIHLAVEFFPESLDDMDMTLVFLPKVTARMLIVQTPASKYKFLRSLYSQMSDERNINKSEILRTLNAPFDLITDRTKTHKRAAAIFKEHASAGKCFTMAGLELGPREAEITATILESRISAVQVHPNTDVSELLLMLLYIVAQEATSGPILYLTKEDDKKVAVKAAVSRLLGQNAVVLEPTITSSDAEDRTAQLFVTQLERETEKMTSILHSASDLHTIFETVVIEDVIRTTDSKRLKQFLAGSAPDILQSDIDSFLEICGSEGLAAAKQKVQDCDKLARLTGECQASQMEDAGIVTGDYSRYLKTVIKSYQEADHRSEPTVDEPWSLILGLAVGRLASRDVDSEAMYSRGAEKLVRQAGAALKDLFGRLAQLRDEAVATSSEALAKKRLVVVFDHDFVDVFDQISRLSPSMIVINNASLWAEWELLPLIKPSVKQLILLGDINLLNTSIENLHVFKKLNWLPSLFEYIRKNQPPHLSERLTVYEQDLARPEMFNLVSDVYTPSVITGKKKKQPFPSSLVYSLFFWSHADPDTCHRGSWVNHGEATRIVTIANYLVENGTSPTDITIVAPFLGQVLHLRQKLKKMKLNIDVFLIGNFLVRTNNTVLVSLVKSTGDLGILEDIKMRCSLLTRANSAMIVFGNAEFLSRSKVWDPVVSLGTNNRFLSLEIPLCCPKHRKTKKSFKLPMEITATLKKPFCTESCTFRFACGHPCSLTCRPEHDHVACTSVRQVQHPVCKHQVPKLCSEDLKDLKCPQSWKRTFSCGHQGTVLCGQPSLCQLECKQLLPCRQHFCKKTCEPAHEHLVCEEDIPVVHPECGHDTVRKCSQSIAEVVCLKKSEVLLSKCGHMSEKLCYQRMGDVICKSKCLEPNPCCRHIRCELACTTVDPHDHSVCRGEVEVTSSDCGHISKRICSQPDSIVVCRQEIDIVFRYCKHTKKVPCWERSKVIVCKEQCQEFTCKRHRCPLSCEPVHDHPKKCTQEVPFIFPSCKHPGLKPCYLPDREAAAILCETLVRTEMSCKVHNVLKKCYEARVGMVCTERCGAVQKCGHSCTKPCQPGHDHSLCLEKIKVPQPCGIHFIELLCGIPSELKCNEEVSVKLPCGHNRMVKCYQARDRIECQVTQKKVFPCGHDKIVRCSESSLVTVCLGYPCQKLLPCGHMCNKRCGETCDKAGCQKCRLDLQREEKVKQDAEWNRKKQALEEAKKSANKLQFSSNSMKNPLDRNSAEFISVEDKVTKYIQESHNWYPTVMKIEKVTNDRLRKRYYECQQELFDPCYSDLKFHGTDSRRIDIICVHGFKLPPEDGKERMYGRGIYFATDSSKSAQNIYTKGSDMLLLCEVLIGKSFTATKACTTMDKERLRGLQCDSLYAKRNTAGVGGVRYDEFVIYDERQAFPTYVIHYRTGAMNLARLRSSVPRGGIQRHELFPTRLFDPNSEEDQHYRIAESQFLRIQQERQSFQRYKLKQVTWVENPTLYTKFLSKQKEFEAKYGRRNEAKPILAFHGTPRPENLELIVEKNFDNSKITRTAYGFGHYFSEFPDISIGYASQVKKLLLCQLLPGKSYDVSANYNIPPGYDSNRVGRDASERGEMIIIANVDQILPCYILHFE